MPSVPIELGLEIVAACRRLYDRNCLAAADGNISVRLDDGSIVITPSGVAKAFMRPSEMALMTLEGEILHGKPSTERLMHLEVYQKVPSARCVVHAHPPTAVAWTLARPEWTELPSDSLPEVILATGRIPIARYARPGTSAMGEVLGPLLAEHRLIILARHGALCWGVSLEEAVGGIERLEHASMMLKLAHDLGGAKPLSGLELEALRALRVAIGPRDL